MNKKFIKIYNNLISLGYSDVTSQLDFNKGKRKIKKGQSIILFDYEHFYFIDQNAKMHEL